MFVQFFSFWNQIALHVIFSKKTKKMLFPLVVPILIFQQIHIANVHRH